VSTQRHGARLSTTSCPAQPTAAVLVFHGGAADSTAPVSRFSPAVLRLIPVARAIARAEPSVARIRLKPGVRRRDHTRRQPDAIASADARFAVAEQAREAPLHGRRQLADVLQEQRAAARRRDRRPRAERLEIAAAGAGAPAEERRLDRLAVLPRAVDVDERLRGAEALVHVTRGVSGFEAVLGQDQQRRRARPIERFARAPRRRRFADQRQRERRARRRRPRRQTPSPGADGCSGMHGCGWRQLRPVSYTTGRQGPPREAKDRQSWD